MTEPKILRVLAPDTGNPCEGCLGCEVRPKRFDRAMDCIGFSADGDTIVDYIYIEDTPEARAAYTALVLEYGYRSDRS